MLPLYEKYRPRTWDEVLGQPKAVKTLRRLVERDGIKGHAFWISGKSGTGKTTIARLLAMEVAGGQGILEIDAGELTEQMVREMRSRWACSGFGKGGRVLILNEAHGLKPGVIRALLTWIEPKAVTVDFFGNREVQNQGGLPPHVVLIFTTTSEAQEDIFETRIDASPLLSRCHEIRLTSQGLRDVFAVRAAEIADLENLNGVKIDPKVKRNPYQKLVEGCHNNMRRVLQKIEMGEMIPD